MSRRGWSWRPAQLESPKRSPSSFPLPDVSRPGGHVSQPSAATRDRVPSGAG